MEQIIDISELIPDDENANKGSEFGNALIEKSLRKFGAGRSILLDKNNKIVAGNKTIENAASIGLNDVIIVETDGTKLVAVKRNDIDLNTKEGREMALADNASAKASITWDDEVIEQLNEKFEIDTKGWGVECDVEFNIELGQQKAEDDDFDIPNEIKTDIVIGDLFEIGEHRLLCGDSTDSEQVAKLMNGENADMVFADPPYGINNSGKGISGATEGNDFGVILGDSDVSVAIDSFKLIKSIFPKSIMIFWGANYYPSILDNGHGWLIWDKEREGNIFSGAEIAYVNKGIRVDVFRHQWHGMIKASESGEKRLHPTQKPVALVSWCFENYKVGNNILDIFLGSGSTMVAAHQLNRKCYGMELDPKYCQVIIDRMHKLDPSLIIKKNGEIMNFK